MQFRNAYEHSDVGSVRTLYMPCISGEETMFFKYSRRFLLVLNQELFDINSYALLRLIKDGDAEPRREYTVFAIPTIIHCFDMVLSSLSFNMSFIHTRLLTDRTSCYVPIFVPMS